MTEPVNAGAMLVRGSVLGLVLILLMGCGFDLEDPDPPSRPQWMPKSVPEAWPEQGIDAHESGGILLEWMEVDDEIDGLKIFRAQQIAGSDSLTDFGEVSDLQQAYLAQEGTYLDDTISDDVRYHYYLRSYNSAGNLSEPSDTISYLILPPVYSLRPFSITDTLTHPVVLGWTYRYTTAMEDYVLTVLDSINQLVYRNRFNPSTYIEARDRHILPDSVLMESNSTYSWRVDVQGSYRLDLESSGGESGWAYFYYVD